MYNVNVYNTQRGGWINYDVSATENTPRRITFYTKEDDGYYVPSDREEIIIRKKTAKPSIYRRGFLRCYKDEYKYQFTETKTRTTTTKKDVYYNEDRDRIITRSRKNTSTRTLYDW